MTAASKVSAQGSSSAPVMAPTIPEICRKRRQIAAAPPRSNRIKAVRHSSSAQRSCWRRLSNGWPTWPKTFDHVIVAILTPFLFSHHLLDYICCFRSFSFSRFLQRH
jgi:hypothetical protein